MVRHIILWKVKDELTGNEKQQAMLRAKQELESLKDKVPGLLSIKVYINGLNSSNADMMLETELENEKALAEYQTNEHHVYAATNFVRPITSQRTCMDFIV